MADLIQRVFSGEFAEIPKEGLCVGEFRFTEPFGRARDMFGGQYRFRIEKGGTRVFDFLKWLDIQIGGTLTWNPNPSLDTRDFIGALAEAERKVYQRYIGLPRNKERLGRLRNREWILNTDSLERREDHTFKIEEGIDSLTQVLRSPKFQGFQRLMACNEYADIALLSVKHPWDPKSIYSEVSFNTLYEPRGSCYVEITDIAVELFFKTSEFTRDDLVLPLSL